MRIPRSLLAACLCLSVAAASGLSGCGSDGGNGPVNSLAGEVTLNFTLQGNTATFTGAISGNPVTITLTRI